jgi:hypothetical protein
MHQAEDKYKNNEGERKGSRNVQAIGYFWLKDQLSRSELLRAAPEPFFFFFFDQRFYNAGRDGSPWAKLQTHTA